MIRVEGVEYGQADEIAQALSAPDARLKPATIRRWGDRGKVPTFRLGRKVYFELIHTAKFAARRAGIAPRGA